MENVRLRNEKQGYGRAQIQIAYATVQCEPDLKQSNDHNTDELFWQENSKVPQCPPLRLVVNCSTEHLSVCTFKHSRA